MPPSTDKLMKSALAAHNAGRIDEAAKLYQRTIKLDPGDDVALHNLGLIASSQHDYPTARALMDSSIKLKPRLAFYRSNFSTVLRAMGITKRAIAEAQTAIQLEPRFAAAWNNLGLAHMDLGEDNKAAKAFEKAIGLDPRYAEAITNFAMLRVRQGRNEEADTLALRALKVKPGHIRAILAFGDANLGKHRFSRAIAAYRRAVALAPGTVDAYIRLGRALSEVGDAAGARDQLEYAAKLAPKAPETHYELGIHLRRQGYVDEAAASFRDAVRLNPSFFPAYASLARTVKYETETDPEIQSMLRAYETVPAGSLARGFLAYGIGEALEGLGEHRRAFEKFHEGNRIRRADLDYDEAIQIARLEALKSVFTREFIERYEGTGNYSEAPIFVVGMPRSGTTLTEQMISASGNVHGAGEINFVTLASSQTFGFSTTFDIPSYVRPDVTLDFARAGKTYLEWLPEPARAEPRFVDKMPHNFWQIGVIHLMFPNAKIVHMNRAPLDTCLSMYKTSFGAAGLNYSYELGELGRYYNLYRGAMQHWRRVLPGAFYDLHYERLVDSPEEEGQKLFDYLELDWSPSVLDFHQARSSVKTASVSQVRRPIYKSSVNLSERYGDLLDPLRAALNEWNETA